MNKWLLTDDGSGQHVRKLSEQKYEVIDAILFPDESGFVARRIVDLADYEMDDDFNATYLKPYDYDDLASMRKQYGDAAEQLIVECIAETEIWERACEVFAGSFKDCLHFIDAIVAREEGSA